MIDGYTGVFKTSEGDMLDLRPQDTCPSQKMLEKYDKSTLKQLLKKGVAKQLKDLREVEPTNVKLSSKLEKLLG